MTPAFTVVGQSLQDDFGADQHEIGPMIDHFQALAFSAGYPGGHEPIEPWLRAHGCDPNSLWQAALERARAGAGSRFH
jgi:hypothetical protein